MASPVHISGTASSWSAVAASAEPRLLTTPEALKEEVFQLRTVAMLLYGHACIPDVVRAFNSLSDETKNALYFWLWMTDHAPQEIDYGKKEISRDPYRLVQADLPFLYPGQANLLEQMIAVMEARKDHRPLYEEQMSCYKHIIEHAYLPHQVKERFYLQLMPGVRASIDWENRAPVRGLLHTELGSHYNTERNGTQFSLYAPHAKQVYAVMTFGGNETRKWEMRRNIDTGYWEVFGDGISPGATYYYEIIPEEGPVHKKIDPLAFEHHLYAESTPRYHSVVRNPSSLCRTDGEWIVNRQKYSGQNLPMNVYKINVLSWKPEITSYRQLAEELVRYAQDMGYTHVELSGILEHPNVDSLGYQPLSLCAPTSRLGSLEDFQYLVDHLHFHRIGVGIDFIPNHFAIDDCGLAHFDGKSVFEHEHPEIEYGAIKFSYDNNFARDYAISCANFWAECGIDFFRVDAVDSLTIKQNPAALYFIRAFNDYLHQRHPGILTMAESSLYSRDVTASTSEREGWGFDAQQDLGRQNDILDYLKVDPFFRHHRHKQLVNAPFAIAGTAINVLSHDENPSADVMPGDEWQQFANRRILRCFQMLVPGIKVTYNGHEYAGRTWHDLSSRTFCQGIYAMSRALNALYRKYGGLWESNETSGLQWIDTKDSANSVVSFHRGNLACVFNMTPNYISEYDIYFSKDDDRSKISFMKEVFSSDAHAFGGSDQTNRSVTLLKNGDKTTGFRVKLPPLGCAVFEEFFS